MLVKHMSSYEIGFAIEDCFGESGDFGNETVSVMQLAKSYEAFGESLEWADVESGIESGTAELFGHQGKLGEYGFLRLDAEDREFLSQKFKINNVDFLVWKGDERKYI